MNGVCAPGGIIVIGYGNSRHGDDGAGPTVAAAIAARNLPNVRAVALPRLLPELIDELEPARFAIFIDAQPGAKPPVVVAALVAANDGPQVPTHLGDPRALLALTWAVYGRVPDAWLVTVGGLNFDRRESLSTVGQNHARTAQEHVEELIQVLNGSAP
jgi:hydrogenase maturation protease